MKRSLFSPPEAFVLSPLLALLPQKGEVGKLELLTSSLYARYEKVRMIKRGSGGGLAAVRGLETEEAMLKQVLEWLAVKPGEGGDEGAM